MLHIEERNRKDARSSKELIWRNRAKLIFTTTVEINDLELQTITRIDQTYTAIFVMKDYSNVIFNDLVQIEDRCFLVIYRYIVCVLNTYDWHLRAMPLPVSVYRYKNW